MKRLICLFLALTLLAGLLCGCGKTEPPAATAAQVEEKATEKEASAESAEKKENAHAKETIKVALVISGTLGDESVHDQAYAGLMQVERELGAQVKAVECTDASMYVDTMQSLCDAGYQLICCDAFSLADALATVAPMYPDVHFMILDTVVDGSNVASFTYATHECSFLAGVAAAMKSESGVIGFIGGMEIPTIQKFQKGFEEGVAYINPDAKVIAKYVGSDASAWNDPATAKSLTMDEIASGADICYHAAGASGMGMIEACVESGIYAIGVNTNQEHLAPENMLTSAMTNGDRAIYLFVESSLNGVPMTGTMVLDCANDGVGVIDSKFFNDEIREKIAACTEQIISGDLKVTDVMAG